MAKQQRRHGLNKNRIENERLRAEGIEPHIIEEADAPPSSLRRRFGPSTHLSAKEKRDRGIVDKNDIGGGAFDGVDPEVAAVFAKQYENLK